ncbi:MAG: hypothetical protein LBV76_00020 [Deltaproteobacteria bacterium]|nr:hypothetical protein [Deltaproteobacteria bacterium]
MGLFDRLRAALNGFAGCPWSRRGIFADGDTMPLPAPLPERVCVASLPCPCGWDEWG